MAAADQDPKGYLVVKVLEVSGKSKEFEPVWDDSLQDAFIKVEVRGGARTIKKHTSTQPVVDSSITFEEQLALEILEGAKELRIMLCKQRRSEGKAGTSVVAACGIFVDDILEAVPIDKFFDLFKPGMGAEGGFVRVSMSFLTPEEARSNGAVGLGEAGGSGGSRAERRPEQKGRALQTRDGLPLAKVALAVAVGALAAYLLLGKKKSKGKDQAKASSAGPVKK